MARVFDTMNAMRNQNLYLVEIKEDDTFAEKITDLSDIREEAINTPNGKSV